nr:MAG TPA: hypothetical protein [Caudoviricetes sp.]
MLNSYGLFPYRRARLMLNDTRGLFFMPPNF